MELYAVKYAEHFKPGTYQCVYRGHRSEELVPGFVFLYFILKVDHKIILIDTGFRNKKIAEYYKIDLIDVQDEVNRLLGDNYKADVIFITHSHFDHSDNLDLYPESEIVIAKAEYDIALEKYKGAVKKVLLSHKLHFVEDEYLYQGKFLFRVIGGHSPGSSVIYFEEEGRHYVLTGDECYSCDNIIKNIPSGVYFNGVNNIEFIADAHNRSLIPLTFHDDKLFEIYEPVSRHIVRII